MRSIKVAASAALMAMTLVACGNSGEQAAVIDLNQVLDVAVVTIDQMEPELTALNQESASDGQRDQVMGNFSKRYTENLNTAQIYPKPLVSELQNDGSFIGFQDDNGNGAGDASEPKVFQLEIDGERSRLIATDLQHGYHRDHRFPFAGLAAGLLIGSMLNRQAAAGVSSSKFSNMQMAPKDYHKTASSRSNARSRSGSGSFSSGK